MSYEAYKSHRRGPTPLEAANYSEPTRVGLVAVQRGVFQAIASMYDYLFTFCANALILSDSRGLPALTIHTVVRQTTKIYARNAKSARVKAWGPTLTGLAVVPLLPYLFDEPVEHVTDYAFDWMKKKWFESRPRDQ